MNEIELCLVNPDSYSDQNYLYSVLKERMREPEYNISHKHLPCWEDHVGFMASDPYRWWWIIMGDDWYHKPRRGVAYIARSDEVGIWIAPEFRRRGIGHEVLAQMKQRMINACKINHRPCMLIANVTHTNPISLAFFKDNAFTLRGYAPEQIVMQWRYHAGKESVSPMVDTGASADTHGYDSNGEAGC